MWSADQCQFSTVCYQFVISADIDNECLETAIYWSGLPFPAPGDRPNPGIKPVSPVSPALAGRFFTTSAIWEDQEPGITLCIVMASKQQ